MKKIIIIASMFITGHSVFSQEATTPVQRAEARTAEMTSKLSLTADQQVKVKNLLTGIESKLNAAENEPSFTPEQRAEQIKMNKEAENHMLKTILTEEQMEKYKELAKREAIQQEQVLKSK